MKALVLMPTYNEAEQIHSMLDSVCQNAMNTDILIIDDRSPDGTAQRVQAHPQFEKRVFLLQREKKSGLGPAYLAGMRWALSTDAYDCVIQMDADFSHDPKDLSRFLTMRQEGWDAIFGSRYEQGVRVLNWDMRRLLLSIGGNLYAKWVTACPVSDMTSGFNCLSTALLRQLNLDKITAKGYGFQIELKSYIVHTGFRYGILPIIFIDRFAGSSKMNTHIIEEAFLLVLWIRMKQIFGFYTLLPKPKS